MVDNSRGGFMPINGKNANYQETDEEIITKKRYDRPVLRIHGSCQLLARTILGGSGKRDQAGGGPFKTH